MSTRGVYGFRKNNQDKLMYNHFDSYPEGLGKEIIYYIKTHTIKKMNEIFNRINPADSIKPISNYSKEELNKYEWILKEFYSNKIIKQEKVMYNIVESYVETHNKLKAFDEEKLDLYPDNNDFILDSLSCEWGYILNLDNNTLEVWKGFQKYPDKKNRYGTEIQYTSFNGTNYYPCRMVYSIKFSELKKKKEEEIIYEIDKQEELISYLENNNESISNKLSEVKNEYIQLSKIKNEVILMSYIDAAYREAMSHIGMEANSIQSNMEDLLDECYIEIDNKNNNDILRSIRDDFLNELRKQINECFFDDKNID